MGKLDLDLTHNEIPNSFELAPNGDHVNLPSLGELVDEFEFAIDEKDNVKLEKSIIFLKTNPSKNHLKQDKCQFVWFNIFTMVILPIGWFVALTYVPNAKEATLCFMILVMLLSTLGIQVCTNSVANDPIEPTSFPGSWANFPNNIKLTH